MSSDDLIGCIRRGGTWHAAAGGADGEAIQLLEGSLGLPMPESYQELLAVADGGVLELGSGALCEGVEPWIYSAELHMYSVREVISLLDGLVRRYLGDCLPFAGDGGPTLFVWKIEGQQWGDVFAIPRGDVDWASGAPVARTPTEMIDRWVEYRTAHDRGGVNHNKALDAFHMVDVRIVDPTISIGEVASLRRVFTCNLGIGDIVKGVREGKEPIIESGRMHVMSKLVETLPSEVRRKLALRSSAGVRPSDRDE